MNFYRFILIGLAMLLSVPACKKDTSSQAAGNKPNNYIIIDGIKHQINYTLCYQTDSNFYVEIDSVDASRVLQPIYFSYGSTSKLALGTYQAGGNMSFSDALLIPAGYGYIIQENDLAGSITISNITSNTISGTFTGSMEYIIPVNGPTTSGPINTCTFSGVFNNDALTHQ